LLLCITDQQNQKHQQAKPFPYEQSNRPPPDAGLCLDIIRSAKEQKRDAGDDDRRSMIRAHHRANEKRHADAAPHHAFEIVRITEEGGDGEHE
jgi:hypothetical protein